MPSIAIVTDTDSSLPESVAAEHGIRMVPITINFGDESYRTGTDMDDRRLFERIDQDGKLPTTAAPSPGAFAEAYEDAFSDGADQVLCICVSSEISTTYLSALTARDVMPDRDITVLDSRTVSMIQGFMALDAARSAASDTGIEEIIARAHDIESRSTLYGALSTLKYIAMSGRVGHLAAGMANLLSIKPILAARDGKLEMIEKVRTRKKSWARMIELLIADVGDGDIEYAALLHVDAEDHAAQFYATLRAALPACPAQPLVACLSAGLSVHTGAGLVGAAIVRAS